MSPVRGVSAQSGPQHPSNYDTIVTAHAAISCLAWVIFFPLGAVITRYLTSPHTWLIHASIMSFSYAMFIASAGLGIWMAVVTQQVCYPSHECTQVRADKTSYSSTTITP